MRFVQLPILLFVLSFVITACQPKQKETTATKPQATAPVSPRIPATLQSALDAHKTEWAQNAPAEQLQIYQGAIQAIIAGGTFDRAQKAGNPAPVFTLQNASGEAVSLKEWLAKGPVVLTWYLGSWSPYCDITLGRLQQELPAIQEAGATLMALTPELPEKAQQMMAKHQLQFEILSDKDNQIAKKYGIVYPLTTELANSYQQTFDWMAFYGNDRRELPLAATYIIQPDGTIGYAFLDADFRNRAEPEDILSALNRITTNL